jgi:hypothetical protein
MRGAGSQSSASFVIRSHVKPSPAFEDARLKPFTDQADDALVADPVFQEADQPILADTAEGSGDRLPIAEIFPIR